MLEMKFNDHVELIALSYSVICYFLCRCSVPFCNLIVSKQELQITRGSWLMGIFFLKSTGLQARVTKSGVGEGGPEGGLPITHNPQFLIESCITENVFNQSCVT